MYTYRKEERDRLVGYANTMIYNRFFNILLVGCVCVCACGSLENIQWIQVIELSCSGRLTVNIILLAMVGCCGDMSLGTHPFGMVR